MGAGLDGAAMVQHDEAVHACDRREAMGNGDDGAPPHELVELFLDRRLDFGIERRGRFVQDQDRRVLEDDASERDALALAARELDAALADMRVEAAPPLPILE